MTFATFLAPVRRRLAAALLASLAAACSDPEPTSPAPTSRDADPPPQEALDVERYELTGEFDWSRGRLVATVAITLLPGDDGLRSIRLDSGVDVKEDRAVFSIDMRMDEGETMIANGALVSDTEVASGRRMKSEPGAALADGEIISRYRGVHRLRADAGRHRRMGRVRRGARRRGALRARRRHDRGSRNLLLRWGMSRRGPLRASAALREPRRLL